MGVDHKFLTGKAAKEYKAAGMLAFYNERAQIRKRTKRFVRCPRTKRLASRISK